MAWRLAKSVVGGEIDNRARLKPFRAELFSIREEMLKLMGRFRKEM